MEEYLRSEIQLLHEEERAYTIAFIPTTSSYIDSLVSIISNIAYHTEYIAHRNEYVVTVNKYPLTELLIRVYPRPSNCIFDKVYDSLNTKRYITITRRKGVMNYRYVVKELCSQFIEHKWTLYHIKTL